MRLSKYTRLVLVASLLLLCPVSFSAVIKLENTPLETAQNLKSNYFLNSTQGFVESTLREKLLIPDYVKQFLSSYEAIPGDELYHGVNKNCAGHIQEWVTRITTNLVDITTDKEKWVLQMIDSWGKFPEGILSGHMNTFGDFHECVQINVKDLEKLNENKDIASSFKGRYCHTYIMDTNTLCEMGASLETPICSNSSKIRPNDFDTFESVSLRELITLMFGGSRAGTMLPSFAICFPNSCSQNDIQIFLINSIYALIPKSESGNMLLPVVTFCEEKDKPGFSPGDFAVIVLLSVLISLCLVAGVLDYWMNECCVETIPVNGKLLRYFLAFSFYTNTKKWLSTKKSADDLGCIHGIRFFSTCWVVLGHTYSAFSMAPAWNNVDVKKIHENWSVMPILNGTFSVDSFFVMSGMLAAFGILKMLDKSGGKFNVLMFYVHRYIRLTPTYAILVAISATLVVYVGTGPYWLVVTATTQFCKDNWWTNLLYINNLVKSSQMCNGESWYLANDFQFYLLSPFIVYPVWRWRKVGLILLVVYTILSIIAPVLVVEFQDAPPAALMTRHISDTAYVAIYQRPWSRIQTFLVGIWLGWLLHETKGKRIKMPLVFTILGWVLSTVLALLVIYGIKPWFDPSYNIPKVAGYFYAGLSRFSWGVVIAWIIFASVKGYGGVINKFLSWKVFMPLGRLTFCVYLTSIHLQMIYHARLPQPMNYDPYNIVNLFFSHLLMSFLVGFLCTILFESPFIVLQKLIFEGKSPAPVASQTPRKNFDNNTNVTSNNQMALSGNEKNNLD